MLPKELFRPLASANREHYWRLLTSVYAQFFGPDADLPPANGWERRLIVQSIETYLENDDPWVEEDEEPQDSPLNVRANMYLQRLAKYGWFQEELVGLSRTISMPPAVSRFMATLINFAEETPGAVGAKMRSIEDALKRVMDPASKSPGDDLDLAAKQARDLVTSMSSMSLRVRNLMRELSRQETTAAAIQKIFEEYIQRLYLSDYTLLAGADHPLARKSDVLTLAQEIAYTEPRDRLITWYAERTYGGVEEKATAHFERAIQRLFDLRRLQDYLDRLELDIRNMHRRMLALIDYRLRAPSHLEVRIKRAIAGVLDAENFDVAVPAGPGQLLTAEGLYVPRVKRPPIPRCADERRELAPHQEAKMRLYQRARDARTAMPSEVRVYLRAAMGSQRQIRASQLPITSIKQFRIVQTLSTYAQEAITRQTKNHGAGESQKLPDYRFSSAGADRLDGTHLDVPDFIISRTK
ncbi:Wadjet anti-phage system protein JetA family protein [Lysobacter yangpyeongensis]|uniref:Wadjet anti-phage system protein JetA family protein n=1 Tax=Lysobacter yangpyeongensis TaxID=346182 RepID=A0ABW0SNY1_9GAMM